MKRSTATVVKLSGLSDNREVSVEPANVKYLFTTKTCPNCRLAREFLKNEKYVLIDAEENMELARKYQIMQAPTLVEVNGDSVKKYVNISNIKKYAEEHSPLAVV